MESVEDYCRCSTFVVVIDVLVEMSLLRYIDSEWMRLACGLGGESVNKIHDYDFRSNLGDKGSP